jgi:hypothetical protein
LRAAYQFFTGDNDFAPYGRGKASPSIERGYPLGTLCSQTGVNTDFPKSRRESGVDNIVSFAQGSKRRGRCSY